MPCTSAGAELSLEFSVTDTGVGVAPDEQKRIFDAFEQADGSVTRRFGGTGLGLAISRQLVELMHGSMGLSSEPDHGSRFSFRDSRGRAAHGRERRLRPHANGGALVDRPAPGDPRRRLRSRSPARARTSSASTHRCDAIEALQAIRAADHAHPRDPRRATRPRKIEQIVSGLRAAAGPRQLEVIALMPPDADHTPLAGATRTLVKPLCTADLLAAASRASTPRRA